MLSTRPTLKRLDVRGTAVTRAGVKRLRRSLSGMRMESDFAGRAPPVPPVAVRLPRRMAPDRRVGPVEEGGRRPGEAGKEAGESAAELPNEPFQVGVIQVIVKSGGLKIPAFTELAEITQLELTCNELTDGDLATLGSMPKLWIFRVSGPITDVALPSVLRYPLLRSSVCRGRRSPTRGWYPWRKLNRWRTCGWPAPPRSPTRDWPPSQGTSACRRST